MLLDDQIAANRRRSVLLFVGFLVLYAAIGWAAGLLWGEGALVVAIAVAVLMTVVALWMGDDLAVRVGGGRQVHARSEAPELWDAIETMSIAAGIPMPRVFVSPDPSPNAFAAGRTQEQAIVCVNRGLLASLDKEELEGVIAHEISHIRNYDVRLMTFAAVLAGSIALLADLMLRMLFFGGGSDRRGSNPLLMVAALVAIVLAPIAATIIQMAISRRREFLADASAAELSRYPQGLASALRVISGSEVRTSRPSAAIAHMYIHAPLGERNRLTRGLFSTHPPIEQRTSRLDELANGVRHVRRERARSEAMARLLGET